MRCAAAVLLAAAAAQVIVPADAGCAGSKCIGCDDSDQNSQTCSTEKVDRRRGRATSRGATPRSRRTDSAPRTDRGPWDQHGRKIRAEDQSPDKNSGRGKSPVDNEAADPPATKQPKLHKLYAQFKSAEDAFTYFSNLPAKGFGSKLQGLLQPPEETEWGLKVEVSKATPDGYTDTAYYPMAMAWRNNLPPIFRAQEIVHLSSTSGLTYAKCGSKHSDDRKGDGRHLPHCRDKDGPHMFTTVEAAIANIAEPWGYGDHQAWKIILVCHLNPMQLRIEKQSKETTVPWPGNDVEVSVINPEDMHIAEIQLHKA